ncbi:MAG: NnrS family protein [Burkholderiaceae bacterium]
MAELLFIAEPRRTPDPEATGFALWRLGFRPFYLLASAFGALSVALWALQFSGWMGHAYLRGPMWHAHEMLFGFVLPVVVGFLFTAGRNWSGHPTPTGRALMALAALWLAGRLLVLTPFAWTAAAVDVAFPLAAALGLARPFIASANRRNDFFVGVLVAMALANAMVHLSELGIVPLLGWRGVGIGLDLVLFVVSVVTGRVLVMFTNNGVPGAGARRLPWLERVASGAIVVLAIVDALAIHPWLTACVASAGALAQLARWVLLKPWKTLGEPIVWVLHVATAWIPLHLAMRALAEVGQVPASSATHALTVGVMGGMIIAMMTRTARGHTGRSLRGGWPETAMYVLVLAAAPIRVFVPLFAPSSTVAAVLASAAAWALGFAFYAARYAPFLTRPRVDGRPG